MSNTDLESSLKLMDEVAKATQILEARAREAEAAIRLDDNAGLKAAWSKIARELSEASAAARNFHDSELLAG